MDYKIIINYVVAAGIAVGAALMPSTASAHPPLGRANARITQEECQVIRNDQKEQCDKDYASAQRQINIVECGFCTPSERGIVCSDKVIKCLEEAANAYRAKSAQTKIDLKKCRQQADSDYNSCLRENDIVQKKHYTAADFVFPYASNLLGSQDNVIREEVVKKNKAGKEEPKTALLEDSVKCVYDQQNERVCYCQPAEKPKEKPVPKGVKKKLTIEEICAQQKTDAQGRCSFARDFSVARAREELWEDATRTGNYEKFGRIASLEEVNAQNKYSFCMLESRIGEMDCIKEAKDEQARQIQAKKDAAANKIKAYESCVQRCSVPQRECVKKKKNRDKEIRKRHYPSHFLRRDALDESVQNYFSCMDKADVFQEKCLPKCGKNPHPEEKYGRIQGLGKIDL